jgi:hypothetical protein
MRVAALPRRFLFSQGCCLAVSACLRMALLGALTDGTAPANAPGASTLLFFMETGTLCALLMGWRGTRVSWWRTAGRGCTVLALTLAAAALAWPSPQRWTLPAIAVAGAMCFALVLPAMSRGVYDFIDRDAVARLTRVVVSVDAMVQMVGPAIVGALLQHEGAQPVLVAMCVVMAAAAAAIWSIGTRDRAGTADASAVGVADDEPVRWQGPLRILVAVSVVEHLLVSSFFAVFADTVVAAGWSASEIGLSISLVYAGTLLAMVLPVPSGQRSRWLLFFVAAGAIPALLRMAFLWVDPSRHLAYFTLLALVGVAIGVEQLLFGVLRFGLVPREQAASLQRQLMFGACVAAAVGAGLSVLGSAAWSSTTTLALSIAVGTATLLAAFAWWIRARPATS